ncbi:MAG TPA: serine/threonine-protein kinase [Planctomycetaceae bacterium]|nr:serine/threonine-protein kinase [Planctomycetaceae bacterium]
MTEDSRFATGIFGLPTGRPTNDSQARDPLEVLASEFVAALRKGAEPQIEAVAAAHPELAAEIQELFPLLTAMEGWKAYRETTSYEHRSLETLPGGQFGDFRIVREIGRGGMGVVFEAEELNTARRVAIKVLPYLKSDARRALFQREASTAARLWHPHIVPVYNFGEHNGLCYYSMRLVRGVSLNWVIDRLGGHSGVVAAGDVSHGFDADTEDRHGESGDETSTPSPPGGLPIVAWRIARNSWFEIARVGAQVADALAFAHANGIVHGDIKPGNLLLDPAANVWVTDFGLSRNQGEPLEQASSGMAGTLRYLAPEQLSGRADVRADVYALGVTLFELSTRTPAFGTAELAVLTDPLRRPELPPARGVNPKIPRDLEAIILKAAAKDPAARYDSAASLRDDLLRFLAARPVRARGAAGWLRLLFRSGKATLPPTHL